jgi:hypothetical protein
MLDGDHFNPVELTDPIEEVVQDIKRGKVQMETQKSEDTTTKESGMIGEKTLFPRDVVSAEVPVSDTITLKVSSPLKKPRSDIGRAKPRKKQERRAWGYWKKNKAAIIQDLVNVPEDIVRKTWKVSPSTWASLLIKWDKDIQKAKVNINQGLHHTSLPAFENNSNILQQEKEEQAFLTLKVKFCPECGGTDLLPKYSIEDGIFRFAGKFMVQKDGQTVEAVPKEYFCKKCSRIYRIELTGIVEPTK